jgi:hypothetical protein
MPFQPLLRGSASDNPSTLIMKQGSTVALEDPDSVLGGETEQWDSGEDPAQRSAYNDDFLGAGEIHCRW